MKKYKGIIINISLLLLFYIVRCLVMNLNVLFEIVLIIEIAIIIVIFLTLIADKDRTREKVKTKLAHVALIAATFLFIGHLISILTLNLYHYRTINIFDKYQTAIPEGNRVNGDWILEEKEFVLTEEEREILSENYSKSSPCLFEGGYCYFEFGGFLHNSGGYCLRLNDHQSTNNISHFGFDRVKQTTRLVGNWMYYN